jgi:hypothetical protein
MLGEVRLSESLMVFGVWHVEFVISLLHLIKTPDQIRLLEVLTSVCFRTRYHTEASETSCKLNTKNQLSTQREKHQL